MKRKRRAHAAATAGQLQAKKQKLELESSEPSKRLQCNKTVNVHPVLSRYYLYVLSLRAYLASRVAKGRRRKIIETFGKSIEKQVIHDVTSTESLQANVELKLAKLLDGVVVGVRREASRFPIDGDGLDDMRKDFEVFSQQVTYSSTVINGLSSSGQRSQQSNINNIVDFAIWTLFNTTYKDVSKPPHVLCHGISRASSTWQNGRLANFHFIPGLVASFPNEHVEALRGPVWQRLLNLLGRDGERLLIDLFLECGLFVPLEREIGTYYQLCGIAISELEALPNSSAVPPDIENLQKEFVSKAIQPRPRRLSEIRFVRSRMLYARAAFNPKGVPLCGLRHIHVFNRYADANNPSHTVHILKYIFPRQFGLHNVFSSKTDPRETVQSFQDYTLRETEIAKAGLAKSLRRKPNESTPAVPKRLRGVVFELVKKLQHLHQRCSYSKLLAHYCPPPDALTCLPSLKGGSQLPTEHGEVTNFTLLATSHAQVYAFCCAVLRSILPHAFLGDHNTRILHASIDGFIKARRYETFTLDAVMNNMRITSSPWLVLKGLHPKAKLSLSDTQKRKELLVELVYYIFDSLLIPLIRTNFHVTETSTHRNRLFYFRHDVWRRLTEPALLSLKMSMFDEIGGQAAFNAMSKRMLGFSQVRLIPKEHGMRPIMNLKRREQVVHNGKKFMGRSINSILAPAFTVLNLEKDLQIERLGASLFSVAGIFDRLRSFREAITSTGGTISKMYFVKVDVKSCFDSLPQKQVMDMIKDMLKCEDYSVSKYAQVMPSCCGPQARTRDLKPVRKFISRARRGVMGEDFDQILAAQATSHKTGSIFVDGVVPQSVARKQVLQLTREHIESNVIKIGKKYYRQKKGIAQGSVVSSLLCNLFYGNLEAKHLDFLEPQSSKLLRLIDDFLLITIDRSQAIHFLQIMHRGFPQYGVTINPSKSFVNFHITIDGSRVPRLENTHHFPYCGMLLDTRTLEVSKDQKASTPTSIADTLTVDYARAPGANFRRKMLSALKIQMHPMLLDTSYNRKTTVLENVHVSMLEVGRKMVQYVKALGPRARPRQQVLVQTVRELAGLAFAMMKSRRNRVRYTRYQCAIRRVLVQFVTAAAFLKFTERRRGSFGGLLMWLRFFAEDARLNLDGREKMLLSRMGIQIQ